MTTAFPSNRIRFASPLGAQPRLASGSHRWWRGPLLVTLLAGGTSVPACHYGEPFGCEKNDTAPEGTRFRVEIIEELPDSGGCLALEPGNVFFVTAGATVEGTEGCYYTIASGPPEGFETGYDYVRCTGGLGDGMLATRCDVAHRDLCPEVSDPGYVSFAFRGRMGEFLLDEGPSEGEFYVADYIPAECAPRASCYDKYRIRISRVMEE